MEVKPQVFFIINFLETLQQQSIFSIVEKFLKPNEELHLLKITSQMPDLYYQLPKVSYQYKNFISQERQGLETVGNWLNVPSERRWFIHEQTVVESRALIKRFNADIIMNEAGEWNRKTARGFQGLKI